MSTPEKANKTFEEFQSNHFGGHWSSRRNIGGSKLCKIEKTMSIAYIVDYILHIEWLQYIPQQFAHILDVEELGFLNKGCCNTFSWDIEVPFIPFEKAPNGRREELLNITRCPQCRRYHSRYHLSSYYDCLGKGKKQGKQYNLDFTDARGPRGSERTEEGYT